MGTRNSLRMVIRNSRVRTVGRRPERIPRRRSSIRSRVTRSPVIRRRSNTATRSNTPAIRHRAIRR